MRGEREREGMGRKGSGEEGWTKRGRNGNSVEQDSASMATRIIVNWFEGDDKTRLNLLSLLPVALVRRAEYATPQFCLSPFICLFA